MRTRLLPLALVLTAAAGLLKGQDQAAQMIFKHAISTISPSREVVLPHRDAEA